MGSSNQKQSNKISAYRKPININLGIIFFAVIFIYLLFYFITYAGQTKISGYQVVTGSLSENNIYRGIAIRSEREFYAEDAGYVNYYAGEGLKSGCGNLVYTLDATGELAAILEDSEKGALSEEELNSIKSEIKNYKNESISSDFSSVYDFKRSLSSLIARYRTTNIMDNITALNQATGSADVSLIRAETSGIVVYSRDGYENLTLESVTVSDLDESEYETEHFPANRLVANGDFVYKMITSEDWYIAIEIDEITANRFIDESYIEVRFLKTQTTSWASAEVRYTGDGILLLLGFNHSMITFATDRFIDIELVLDKETGLKIPNSAIEEKEFYIIPVSFVTKGSNSLKDGVIIERYNENGELERVFTEIEIYSVSDDYYYISKESLELGTNLIRPGETYLKEPMLDSDEIRDSYTPVQNSGVGVPSNEVEDGDQVIYNEDGDSIVVSEQTNRDVTQSSNPENAGTENAGTENSSAENTGSEGTGSGNSETENSGSENTASENPASEEQVGAESGEETTSDEQNENGNGIGNEQENKNGSKMTVGATGTLIGVYNMNKGYADFRQITILYQNDEYAIVKPNTMYGLCEYDYIVLDASAVSDNDLIY